MWEGISNLVFQIATRAPWLIRRFGVPQDDTLTSPVQYVLKELVEVGDVVAYLLWGYLEVPPNEIFSSQMIR